MSPKPHWIYKYWPWGEIDIMACYCKDSNGEPALRCSGTCQEKAILEAHEESQRRDPLNGFTEVILARVSKMISDEQNRFQLRMNNEQLETYKKGFLEGLKEGIEIGKNIYE